MNQLASIKEILQNVTDNKCLFDDPVRVKATPHQHVFTIYGAWLGDAGIFLMDGDGAWHGPLEEGQLNASFIISSLYQRLKISHASPVTN